MFSNHLQKIDRTAGRNLLWIAAALVIVCQLVAMALVAGSQVQKAALRESKLTTQNLAMARCFEASARYDRHSCMLQATADTQAAVSVSQSDDKAQDSNRAASPAAMHGFMAVAFGAN